MSSRGGRRRNHGGRGQNSGDMAVDQPNGSNASNNQARVPHIEVRNWEGGTMTDVVGFIERKARTSLQNPKQNGRLVIAQIEPHKVRDLEKWNGAKFAGQNLNIKVVYRAAEPSPETSRAIQILEGFLQTRYDPQSKLLNLTMMMSDPTLQASNMLDTPAVATKMFKALMKLAGDKVPDLQSVSLEANNLADTELVESVAGSFPQLLNLSLANNQIQSVESFRKLRNKLRSLRELVLAGNPIQMHPQFQAHAQEIVGIFPSLLILDGVPVRSEADLPKNALPAPIVPTFFEDEAVASVTPIFLANFFGLWDTDRSALMSLYDQASLFSLCFDTSAPHSPTSHASPATYIPLSRNLERNTSAQTRHSKIHIGPAAISAAFNNIPASKHDLANAAAYAIDSWKVSDIRAPGDMAIMIVVHGEFFEPASRQVRSFDRTLVVLPGLNGSYIVASDMLNIRLRSALPVSETAHGQAPAVPAQPTSQGSQPPSMGGQPAGMGGQPAGMGGQAPNMGGGQPAGMGGQPAGMGGQPTGMSGQPAGMGAQPAGMPMMVPGVSTDNNAALTQELMRQTGLTADFARMCLEQANYNPSVALELFNQSRAQLPPNAFQ